MVNDLYSAAEGSDLDRVKLLVKQGADITAKDKNGRTPLYYANKDGYSVIIKYLIKESIKSTDHDSYLPLHDAAESGALNLDLAKFLINDQGMNVDAQDKYGRTTLHLAVRSVCMSETRCSLDIVALLVKRLKADINAQDKYGQTPLHFAAVYGRLDIVRCLVEEYNADVNTNSDIKWDALRYVVAYGHLDIVKYLVEKCKVDIKATDVYSHCAARHGHLDILKYLVIGESKLRRDTLCIAYKNGHVDVMKYLVENCRPSTSTNLTEINVALMGNPGAWLQYSPLQF